MDFSAYRVAVRVPMSYREYIRMDHAFSSAKVTVEVVRHATTVRLNSCESHMRHSPVIGGGRFKCYPLPYLPTPNIPRRSP